MKILEKIKKKTEEDFIALFELYLDNSEYKQAAKLVERHRKYFNNNTLIIKKLKLFRMLGDEESFIRELKAVKKSKVSNKVLNLVLFEEGLFYYGKGELKKAKNIFTKIINLSSETSIKTRAKRYLFFLRKNKGKGNIDELLELYALKLKENDYYELGNISSDIGQSYFKDEQLPQALSWFELSEYFFKKIENKRAYTLSLFNQGEVLKEMGEFQKAEDLIAKSLDYDSLSGNIFSKMIDLFSLAEISFLKGNYKKSFDYLKAIKREDKDRNLERKIPLFPLFYDFLAFVVKKEEFQLLNSFDFTNLSDWKEIVKKFSSNFFDELKILLIYVILAKNTGNEINQSILNLYENKIKLKKLDPYFNLLKKFLKGDFYTKWVKENISESFPEFEIIGFDTGLSEVKEFSDKIKNLPFSVLITGESGTGKELIAKYLHYSGVRKDNPLVIVNCAAIPKELLESMFFGYKKGAFTGATEDRKGFIESAQKGTLFLDEIGELPLDMQSKLLRVIQEKEIIEIGSSKPKKIDVRFIFATNRDLEKEVERGSFRKDLFYRINELRIDLPPLRERKEDIPLLVNFFIRKYEKFIDKKGVGISNDVLDTLTKYNWPGNIRELEVEIKKAVVLLSEDEYILNKKHFSDRLFRDSERFEIAPLRKIREKAEKEYLSKVFSLFKNTKKDILAKKLGVSRMQLYNLLKKYGIKE